MDLNDKIKQILVDKNMSPSIFADEIGIQRSSMSHILAGRNKPSLDIVQKIVKRFPELGTNWILDDEDLPEITPNASAESSERSGTGDKMNTDSGRNPVQASRSGSISMDLSRQSSGKATGDQPGRRIEKILVFYSDGTFEEVK